MFSGSDKTKVAKETRETTNGAHDQMNEVPVHIVFRQKFSFNLNVSEKFRYTVQYILRVVTQLKSKLGFFFSFTHQRTSR